MDKYHFDDFTESNYRKILKILLYKKIREDGGRICTYQNLWNGEKNIIWRHDIDCSVHRALKLAQLEADMGIRAIYFVMVGSQFYNMMEKGIYDRLIAIKDMGHEIGIHFDCESMPIDTTEESLVKKLEFLKGLFEGLFQQNMSAFSFHNPTKSILNKFYKDQYAGLYNAYSKKIRAGVSYCSDSNGYWRYRRLEDFLLEEETYPMCVLTHPLWWTPDVMPPARRIQRALEGRKRNVEASYESMLKKYGRINVK